MLLYCVSGENTTEIVGERGVLVQNWGDAPSAAERFDCAAPSLKWFLRDRGEWVVSDVEAPRAQAERIAGRVFAPEAVGAGHGGGRPRCAADGFGVLRGQ